MVDNIVVITQNVKLESLCNLRDYIKVGSDTLVFSTQLVFDNEKHIIEKALESHCVFKNFSDFMSDSDYQKCDEDAYVENGGTLADYYKRIKYLKNSILVERLLSEYLCRNLLLVSDDLGLDETVWLEKGFKKVCCDYYHEPKKTGKIPFINFLRYLKGLIMPYVSMYRMPIYSADYNGVHYLFYGSLNRIGYRFNIQFMRTSKIQNVKDVLLFFFYKIFGYVYHTNVVRMSTLHEQGISRFYNIPKMNLKLIQDGYLPSNYSSKYLLFNGKNIDYYTWDFIGGMTFDYHHLPHSILPFRKKLYLPPPSYPKKVRKVLCVASGAGDWTAVKNRCDEDKMIEVFGKVAVLFPEVEFVYRCHPVWIHPLHQGVNSIRRAAEYVNGLGLPNFKLSSNIPNANEGGHFILSYKRSSLEEDLKDVDVVFGEHSISMIDAAFKKIIFCSVNVTGRRNFFESITEMGFPHCESCGDIAEFLKDVCHKSFQSKYEEAVIAYNRMTDKDC